MYCHYTALEIQLFLPHIESVRKYDEKLENQLLHLYTYSFKKNFFKKQFNFTEIYIP